MIIRLIPVEVDVDSISDPTSSIITPDVISSFAAAGGDFLEAVPLCLLRARALFMRDSKLSRELLTLPLWIDKTDFSMYS